MEKNKSTIIDVRAQIERFRATVCAFMEKIKPLPFYPKGSEESKRQAEGLKEDFTNVASACEQLFRALEKSNPEKLADEDLFALWESLFRMDQVKQFPGGGTAKNLEMLKIVSVGRIRAFFNNYHLYTIGVDERLASKKDGSATMVLDLVLEDDGGNKLKKVDLPWDYVSVHRENGGIFITIDVEDIPRLLARGAKKDELAVGMGNTRGKVQDTMSKLN
jgi:hypothetical protein